MSRLRRCSAAQFKPKIFTAANNSPCVDRTEAFAYAAAQMNQLYFGDNFLRYSAGQAVLKRSPIRLANTSNPSDP